MASLTDDITQDYEGTEPSLLTDILKAAGSSLLTAGAHGVKGVTLGLLDPTQEVAELIGEDIYEAAPSWARTGAEWIGTVPPVTGALKLARAAIPGVGMIPRVLQGFAAGAGLHAVQGLAAGENASEMLKGSLLEGAFFGGIEGLLGIPAMLKQRRLRPMRKFWERSKYIGEEGPTWRTAEPASAEGLAAEAPIPETVGKKKMDAILMDQAFTDDPAMLMTFKMMGDDVTIQTADTLVTGKIHGWNKTHLTLQTAPGAYQHFPLKDFRLKKNVRKLRMFRGNPETHIFPRNRSLELAQARGDVRKLQNYLYREGVMAKSDMEKLRRFVNPRVKRISHLSEHELHTYTNYLNKLAKGEQLPHHIMDQVKIYGPAMTDVRVGILATFRPARWMFESLNRKLPWMMDRFFNPTVKAVGKRSEHQLALMDRVRELAGDLTRKELKEIYKIDKYLADKIRMVPGTPQYMNIRGAMMDSSYKRLSKQVGQKTADKLRHAHEGFRELYDEMFKDLVDAGILPRKRYIKEYWPLLRDQSIVTMLFKGKGQNVLTPQIPKHVKGFMQYVRKNVIENPETDILKLTQAYISTYTKLLHLRPVVDDMYKLFSDFKLKKDVRDLMKHYLARQLGIPSEVDYRIAASLKGAFEHIPFLRQFGKNFTTNDWLRVGAFFTNLPYYAHMGLRPFAAARNLMQPFLTTGPMIGNRWLVRGYQAMLDPTKRKYIKDIGGLQESLGEYTRRLHIKPSFKDKFANFLMYMFRSSDEMNRYAAGLGMAQKFDHFYNKLGMTEEFFTKIKLRRFRSSVRTQVRDKAKVYRALKELETHRYPKGSPARNKLLKTVEEFSHGEAYKTSGAVHKDIRDTIAKEAIGDTQWLYGKEQSPLFGYRAGAFGRQALTYQTWWLNYFEFIKNLGRTTKAGDYAPLATAFANNILLWGALSYAGWEGLKIGRTIAFGPFTGRTVAEGEMPPGVDPFVKSMGAVRAALMGDFEGAEKRVESAMKKAWDNWIPGSLVYKELAKVGVTPRLDLFGKRLTPKATKRFADPGEKIASVFGRA